MYFRFIFFLFSLIFVSSSLQAQVRITIFYDSTWAINSRDHASYYRNTFLDTIYTALIGPVQDHYADGSISMKGKYSGGRKQGPFNFYYPSGQLKVQGAFSNNDPLGTWKFFYEDGKPRQTLEFVNNDFRVLSYHDPSGIQKVKQGNGRYEGMVYGFSQADTLYLDGLVADGYKDGEWVYYDEDGTIIYVEKYKKGKFRNRLIYNQKGLLLTSSKEPIHHTMVLPFELIHTERFVYAPDIRQSDYPYFDFLPDEDTLYFDENWEECDSLAASYYRPTNVQNKENPSGYIRDYYMNGQLQMEGRFIKGNKSGPFRYYHNNGQLSSAGSYQDNRKIAIWREYYPDGDDRQVLYYEDGKRFVEKYWTPDGKLSVFNGSGNYKGQIRGRGGSYKVEGSFRDYKKISEWKGYRDNGSLYFEETYEKGELVSGTSYDDDGNAYQYVQVVIDAQPDGGMKDFYAYLSDQLEYPYEARRLNIDGKVFTQLIVTKDGNLSRINTISSPHPTLSREAERVIRKYGKWQPGKVRGQLVKMRFILPITFSLSG